MSEMSERDAFAYIAKLWPMLLHYFGTTDPDLLEEVWEDRVRAIAAEKASEEPRDAEIDEMENADPGGLWATGGDKPLECTVAWVTAADGEIVRDFCVILDGKQEVVVTPKALATILAAVLAEVALLDAFMAPENTSLLPGTTTHSQRHIRKAAEAIGVALRLSKEGA